MTTPSATLLAPELNSMAILSDVGALLKRLHPKRYSKINPASATKKNGRTRSGWVNSTDLYSAMAREKIKAIPIMDIKES